MSQSNLQLLLHAGELEYIYKTIRKSLDRNNTFVGGCLFGLWRNSLQQPVIQFVTGPGSTFKSSTSVRKLFYGNKYFDDCAEIVKNNHRLLHLGFWFYGPDQDQDEAKRQMASQSKYSVLLLINYMHAGDETLGGEYFLGNGGIGSPLFKEDVLEQHSSFRKFKPLTDEIKEKGSDVVSLEYNGEVEAKARSFIRALPSRVEVEVAETKDDQWYSSEKGMADLQLLFQYFQAAGITPSMSRDTVTQDMQFGLSDGYCLEFPAKFPREMPSIRAPDGSSYEMKRRSSGNEDVCGTVVQTVVEFLGQISSRRQKGGRYY